MLLPGKDEIKKLKISMIFKERKANPSCSKKVFWKIDDENSDQGSFTLKHLNLNHRSL